MQIVHHGGTQVCRKEETMKILAIRARDVCKEYRLGQLNGGTLQNDLESWWAQVRGKEDPNRRIGADRVKNGKFLALDHIDLDIYAGEALGIIGKNGAGKSTLLKLLSRVTAPTGGDIDIYGKVTSMLEVGIGFHREMTGRENIYLNGTILGMTRKEIDRKIDDIIEFSEIAEFIDTPVKRYSSGMYVKLAFSVAAHLPSDIMIMDEVLAVGDMMFQKKCLERMRQKATEEGKTVLYVSHNMSTISQLCERCIVMDHGKITFEGDTREAISVYLENSGGSAELSMDLDALQRRSETWKTTARLLSAEFIDKDSIVFQSGEQMQLRLAWRNLSENTPISLRIEVWTTEQIPQGSFLIENLDCPPFDEKVCYDIKLDLGQIVPGDYSMKYTLYYRDEFGNSRNADSVTGLGFQIIRDPKEKSLVWDPNHWGHVYLQGAEAKRSD